MSGQPLSLLPEASAPLLHLRRAGQQTSSHTGGARAGWQLRPLVEAWLLTNHLATLKSSTKTPGRLRAGDKMGGEMTAIIPTFWLSGLPDLLSSEHCETRHGVGGCVSPRLGGEGSHEQSLEGGQRTEVLH